MCTQTAQEHTHTNTTRVPVPEQALQASQSLRFHHCGPPTQGTICHSRKPGEGGLGPPSVKFCNFLRIYQNLKKKKISFRERQVSLWWHHPPRPFTPPGSVTAREAWRVPTQELHSFQPSLLPMGNDPSYPGLGQLHGVKAMADRLHRHWFPEDNPSLAGPRHH